MKLSPLIVTSVPPATGPLSGLNPDTDGAATNVNWSTALDELGPPADVTVISTVPATVVGDTVVIDVSPLTTKARRRIAEGHRADTGEAGAGDRDTGAAGRRALARGDPGDPRRRDERGCECQERL